MRYIRFLKTPRIAYEKNSSKPQITCLITITSDLGDSFLPHNITLSAELIHIRQEKSEEIDTEEGEVILWQAVQWKGGMRTLPVTFPLSKSHSAWPVHVRIGVEPKSEYDEFKELVEEQGWRGVVSAWSEPLDLAKGVEVSEKLVQRRFQIDGLSPLEICEETGESIARHLWCVFFHHERTLLKNCPGTPVSLWPATSNPSFRPRSSMHISTAVSL